MVLRHTQSPTRQERSSADQESPYRIAIIGGGPRGLYCLESLSRALRRHPRVGRIAIDIFDPCLHIGAGNVYAVNQPDYLRMNFPNAKIDAWISDEFRREHELSLQDWLQTRYPQLANPDGFAPRAVVGRYLHECFGQVRTNLPEDVALTVHRLHVTDISKRGCQWIITTDDQHWVADDLVMTTGHEGWRSTSSFGESDARQIIGRVFPIESQLSRAQVPPQSRVAIRGFGLTWIDATVALTEGRDGQFRRAVAGLRYECSGGEPSKIYPYSRTGRPLLAKSIESKMTLPTNLPDVWQSGSQAILGVSRSGNASQQVERLWRTITKVAADVYQSLYPKLSMATAKSRLSQWYDWWSDASLSGLQAYEAMKQSRDIGLGMAPPNEAWVWGVTWRQIYPALVDRVSHGGLSGEAWKLFRPITAEMERLAFGPPPENMSRMLALIDAEIVDLKFIRGAEVISTPTQIELQANGISQEVDAALNAVIPSPYEIDPHGPLSRLLDSETVVWEDRDIGLPIDQQGCPLSYPRDNLAILGRVTEGTVLGNDSLSRKLHPHIENWAVETVKRIFHRRNFC